MQFYIILGVQGYIVTDGFPSVTGGANCVYAVADTKDALYYADGTVYVETPAPTAYQALYGMHCTFYRSDMSFLEFFKFKTESFHIDSCEVMYFKIF